MAKPVAGDDFTTISTDDPDLVIAGNLLGNDNDPDEGTLLLRFVNGIRVGDKGTDTIAGTYGTFTFNKDGTFNYALDPANPAVQALAPGETLRETLNYKISDGNGETDYALFTLEITEPNHEPEANLDQYALGASSDVISGNVLINDADPDGDDLALSFIGEDSPLTYIPDDGSTVTYQGQYGAITIGRDGTFTYDVDEDNPAVAALQPGEHIAEYFTYKIWDGEDINSADQNHIIITINGDLA